MKLTYDEVIEKAMPQIRKAFKEGQVKYGDPDIGNLDGDNEEEHIQDHLDSFILEDSYERDGNGVIKKHHLAGVIARCMMLIVRDELK